MKKQTKKTKKNSKKKFEKKNIKMDCAYLKK